MSFNNSKVQSLINKIKSQILGDIEDKIEEHDVVANSSRTGHVQAGGSPQDINLSGTSSAGTDNGYYARADHVHKIATASTTGKGIVQLDSTPTTNSSNGVTSNGIKSALDGKVSTSDSRLTDTRTPKSHTHGNISNTGTMSGKGQNVVTDSNGNIITEAKPTIPSKTSDLTNDGDGTNVFVKNNDSRLSDSRTPTSHNHSISDVTNLQSKLNQKVDSDDLGELAFEDLGTFSNVAITGDYTDLTSLPSIPTKTSDLTNDSGFLTSHNPIDSSLSSTSTNAVQNKVINTALNGKANSGHTHNIDALYTQTGLQVISSDGGSSNIFLFDRIKYDSDTSEIYYTNLNYDDISFEDFATQDNIPTKTSDLTNDSGFLTSHQDISGKVNTGDLGSVAFSNDYEDLDNLPTIPSAYTHPSTHPANMITGLSTVATSGSYDDLINKPTLNSFRGNGTLQISDIEGLSNQLGTSEHNHDSTYVAKSSIKQTVTDGDTTGIPSGDAVYNMIDTVLDNIITQLRS